MNKYHTKIDPITGVEVLTIHGLMQSEADHHDTTVQEEYQSLYAEMDKEYEERIAQLKDKERLKIEVNHYVKEIRENQWADFRRIKNHGGNLRDSIEKEELAQAFLPYIEEVLEVLEADSSCSFRESTESVTAKVLLRNGKTDIVSMVNSQFSGSFYEPPDGELWVEYHGDPLTHMRNHNDCEHCK